MGAFLTSLTNVASQYAEGKEAARTEKEARAAKMHQMDAEDAYLQIAKQAEQRQEQEFEFRKKSGDFIGPIDGRWWSVSQGKFIDQQRPNPMDSLKKFIATQPPEVQGDLASRAQTYLEANPSDSKGAITEVMRIADEARKEKTHREEHTADVSESEKFRKQQSEDTRSFQRSQRQEMEGFQKMMVDLRLSEKQKYMTPQERQVYDSIKQVSPSVDRTIDFLEKTKNSDGQPLMSENAYVFGDRSALMQHLRFRGYKFGAKQEDVTQQLIKNAALIQVLGARPWMTMGRGKYLYETIAQHLPAPTDTPALLYDKLTWLRDNVLTDARNELADYVTPGISGSRPSATGQPSTDADPLGVLPGAKP